jgi:zinc D-Ala-D-Ala carboxypeptidase
MRLSKHFSLSELTKSETAIRKGIDNTPDARATANLMGLCTHILEPVRKHYKIPFSPNSGFRSPELNEAIGSSNRSQHIRGEAVDFELPGVANKDLALWIRDNCDYDQLILEFYQEGDPSSGWVHCSYTVHSSNRRSARIFDGKTWTDLT